MKLWKKIVILVLTVQILSFVGFSTVLLHYMEKKQMMAVLETRKEHLENLTALLEKVTEASDYSDMTEITKKSMASFYLKKYAPDGYAITGEEKTLASTCEYDITPYKPWFEKEEGKLSHTLQKINKKTYLILSENLSLWQEKYALYGVKDITSVYQELEELFFCLLIAGMVILGVTCLILIFSVKTMTAKEIESHIEELKEVSMRQQQLLGALSHEIKTPVTSLIGYSDTLLHVKLSEEQKEKALSRIYEESKRMERLSSKLMSLIGLYENDSIKMEKRPIETVMKHVKDAVFYSLEEKKIHAVFSWENFSMMMDSDLLESLLMNLIDNSKKASNPGSTIEVKAVRGMLSVRDYGCGIPEEELKKVKEPFYMIDKARKKREGSIGLGLSLCNQIAILHGGSLEIDSKPGEGTCIRFVWEHKD